jgi:uncharacterized protein YutE (UPF0331/DUF86 family)
MTINGIIEKKLRLLEQKLSEINDWQITSYAEFSQSSLKINAVERALTVCVEIMIDISERILAIKKIPPKDTSVENFKELERLKIIQSFETYADMIRFRNFIVHRYETIDTQILFAIVTKKLKNFRSFADEIRNTAPQGT